MKLPCGSFIYQDEVGPGKPLCVLPKGHSGFCSDTVGTAPWTAMGTIAVERGSVIDHTDEFRQAIELAITKAHLERAKAKLEELGVDVKDLLSDPVETTVFGEIKPSYL